MAALAKISDIKARIGVSQTSVAIDAAVLLPIVTAVSGLAERLVGVEPGGLRRTAGIVEYPWDTPCDSPFIRLSRRPVESIANLKQVYLAGGDAAFEAVDGLVEFDDYALDRVAGQSYSISGKIERLNASWYRRRGCIRAEYTAGYVDPARIEVALTGATWTATTKTLHQTGAFAGYSFVIGDCIVITGGTGAEKGTYTVASKVDADNITLATSIAAGNLTGADITSGYAGMILPPEFLQEAVIDQAIWVYNSRASAGVKNFGDAGVGAYDDIRQAGIHPMLDGAAKALRRAC